MLDNSAVTGNESTVAIPNGRFAIGGGVHIQDGGTLTIRNSVVSNNSASLSSLLPRGIEMLANGGGIHVGERQRDHDRQLSDHRQRRHRRPIRMASRPASTQESSSG